MTQQQPSSAPTPFRYLGKAVWLLLIPVLSTAVIASPGAHTHGEARLQVAIDGADIDLIFTSPAANLVGFEHEPENDRQYDLIDQATRWFRETALVNLEHGGCEVTDVDVSTGFEEAGHHAHHDHDTADSHSDFEVSQRLRCDRIADGAPALIITPLPQQFQQIEHLAVDWVTDGKQGSSSLHDGDRTIRLDR